MARKTIRLYLFFVLLGTIFIGFHHAIYVIFLMDSGMNLLQVNMVNFFYMLAVFGLEVPTGAVADLKGRKVSYVLSNLIIGLGFLIYGMSRQFTGFITAEIIIALGVTLTSGAFRAWLVDSLHFYEWPGELVKIFRWEGRVKNVAALVGAIVGAHVGSRYGLHVPFLLAGGGFICLSLIAGIYMQEKYPRAWIDEQQSGWWRNMMQIGKDSINYGLKHKMVFLVVIATFVMFAAFQPLNMYWQPWFRGDLPGDEYLSYVWTGIVLFAMLGNELVVWFNKYMRSIKTAYIVIGYLISGMVLLMALVPWWMVSLGLYWLHEVIRGLIRPYTDNIVQSNIPSKTRATVDSFVSMVGTGSAALGLLVFGGIAQVWSIQTAWIVAAVWIVILLPTALLFNGKNNS